MPNARILKENLEILHSCIVPAQLETILSSAAAGTVSVATAKDGHEIPRVLSENGKWVSLHSSVNPVAEARTFAEGVSLRHNELPVVLGAGFGYHLAALTGTFQGPVIVVEQNAGLLHELFNRRDIREITNGQDVFFICSNSCSEVINAISRLQVQHNLKQLRVLSHMPTVRAYNSFYDSVQRQLQDIGSADTMAKLRYRKFKQEQLNILVLHSKYYLLAEIIQSLKHLGHNTKTIILQDDLKQGGDRNVIEKLLYEILSFKPDFILTVNHLGFDREGILTQLFDDIEMPYASWFVDNPLFILEDFEKQVSPYLCVFMWDTDYINDMKHRGFEHICPLPLATDPTIFRKIPSADNPVRHLQCEVGFVGSSWINSITECVQELPDSETALDLLYTIAGQYSLSAEKLLENITLTLSPSQRALYEMYMHTHRKAFEPAVTWMATQQYRLDCIKKLYPFRPHIFGDPGWHTLVNGQTVIHDELNYYDELPGFYNVCTINFNTTSAQMKRGFNQRVFDVPACGGFILTDYREQLENAFEIGSELVCFKDPEEIPELVRYYLENDAARERIIANAYKRVMNEHTYIHRLQIVTSFMARIYG